MTQGRQHQDIEKRDRAQAAAALDAPKLLAARRLAVATCPYLAVALHAIAIVPTYAVPTMGVDRHWRCYVNPAFVSAHAVRDLAGVWLHEVSHLVRDHHTRARRLTDASIRHEAVGRPGSAPLDPGNPRREQVRLNIAMDLEINDDLFEGLPDPDDPNNTGPRLPKGALTPASLRVPERDLFEEYVHDVTPSMVAAHWTDCGSGAHDGPTPWEDDAAGAHPLGDYEAAAIRISVRDAIAAGRGTAPAGWQRWAERYGKVPQDWRTLLGAAFRASLGAAAGAGDYTYRRPSRRSASLGGRLVLPSLRRPLPQVAVVIDTSGSVSDVDLGSALTELAAIARAVGVSGRSVAVYTCDAAVQTAQHVCQAEELTLVGGGGTDLRKGIRAAMTRAPRPDVTVVLTDGKTPWPEEEPGSRVVAGIFASPRSLTRYDSQGTFIDRRPPQWIETVYLE
ncbi:vWA domain-containing protein [Catenulispora acidiphila]|uniref:vWA domain-containing protein n=1 Tax=Catenulispora acidiphila TaxID=304895 RepID=UPI00019E078C|nr:VWA-like domain-containing protein [Catenulispora acidiphila]